ncbi:MAG: hypothetical protein ACR2P5_04010 [Gammaproteobacteria bacterium]
MLFISAAVAGLINARQTEAERRRMQAHAGRVVALRAGALRLCFRLDAGGYWRAVLPEVAADAEAHWRGADLHLDGDGALLRDLNGAWERNSPRQILAEIMGADAAGFCADAAARLDIKNILVAGGVAAPPSAVAEFNRNAAAVAQKSRELESRLARLEGRHGET